MELRNDTTNNTTNDTSLNTAVNSSEKEIFRQDFSASSGYTFNIKVEDLANELMRKFKSSNPQSTVEMRELSGAVDWIAIGWFDGDELEVTGINIYSTRFFRNCYFTNYWGSTISLSIIHFI